MFLNEHQSILIRSIQENLSQGEQVSKEIRDSAVKLFFSLHDKRPDISTSNAVIGAKDENGRFRAENIHEYFNNRKRIEFLLFWTLNILPILEILSSVGKLPISRKENDFEEFINSMLNSYVQKLDQLPTNIMIDNDDIKVINENCNDLKEGIIKYLEGFPAAAFEKVKSCMNRITDLNLEQLTNDVGGIKQELFKMRLGSSNSNYDWEDMFHIPFEKRGLVKTNRYSISGLPCVYLGSTPLTCWEEMGKPDLNMTHTSLFLPGENLTYFNISNPPLVMAEHLKKNFELYYGIEELTELYKILRTYMIVWPLIACCSIRVLNPGDSFKPEYIVPQLLLQWIQQSSVYDGICYFSTKIDNYNRNNFSLYKNFAFPVKMRKEKGHCEQLREKFIHITNAVPWQLFLLHKGSGETAISERYGVVEFTPGLETLYKTTDFGRLETFLINIMGIEKARESKD
jgi:hypothetical protein